MALRSAVVIGLGGEDGVVDAWSAHTSQRPGNRGRGSAFEKQHVAVGVCPTRDLVTTWIIDDEPLGESRPLRVWMMSRGEVRFEPASPEISQRARRTSRRRKPLGRSLQELPAPSPRRRSSPENCLGEHGWPVRRRCRDA